MTAYFYNGNRISAPITFRSNEPMFSSDTISLKTERSSQNAQRWELSFQLITIESSSLSLVGSVFRDAIGSVDTMIMPQLPSVNEAWAAGSMSASATYSAGTTTINIYGSGVIPAGSFIKFSNHSKVYLTESTVNGSGSTRIHPGLIQSVPSSTGIQHGSNCLLTYSRDVNDIKGITFSDGILSNAGTVNLVEEI